MNHRRTIAKLILVVVLVLITGSFAASALAQTAGGQQGIQPPDKGLFLDGLTSLITVLIALSVAAERFVEIIKSVIPFLREENANPAKEGWRRAILQFMAVVAGIVTALLARPALEGAVAAAWTGFPGILALGLLASGGSGFWNSVLSYVLKVKDIKKVEAEERKRAAAQ